MAKDAQASAIVRDIENRIVWLAAFLRHPKHPDEAARLADSALDSYQSRFEPLDVPAG